MKVFACTLLADGSSDRVLQPILSWLLVVHCPFPYAIEYAPIHRGSLSQRVAQALQDFPCDLLFVHRDAEGAKPADRQLEVDAASPAELNSAHVVAVIPVRMTEAWLLFDEGAIRRAADNPNGSATLNLPKLTNVEQLPDPKATLFEALRTASGLPPQRLKRFRPETGRLRIAELVDDADFSPLRQLPAFQRLEAQVQAVFQD